MTGATDGSAEQVAQWVQYYVEQARARGLPVDAVDGRFQRWFDLMGAQRHLKATGIFARLKHRDGKPRYTHDIPRTLGYVRTVATTYPELDGLHRLLLEVEAMG